MGSYRKRELLTVKDAAKPSGARSEAKGNVFQSFVYVDMMEPKTAAG